MPAHAGIHSLYKDFRESGNDENNFINKKFMGGK